MSIFNRPRPASEVGELAAVWKVPPIRISETSRCLHLTRATPIREKWLSPTMQVDSMLRQLAPGDAESKRWNAHYTTGKALPRRV